MDVCKYQSFKEIISMQRTTIEFWMHLGGLLSTQGAKVAQRFLRFFRT